MLISVFDLLRGDEIIDMEHSHVGAPGMIGYNFSCPIRHRPFAMSRLNKSTIRPPGPVSGTGPDRFGTMGSPVRAAARSLRFTWETGDEQWRVYAARC